MIASRIHDLRRFAFASQIAALVTMLAAWSSVAQEEAAPSNADQAAPAAAASDQRAGSAQSPLPALRQAAPVGSNRRREVLPISGKILRYAQKLVEKYDANGDGQLQADEWGQMSGTPRLADLNGDGILTVEELAERVASYSQQRSLRLMPTPPVERGTPLAANGLAASAGSNATAVQKERAPTKQFFVPTEQLPKGLAEWFTEKDRDGDGQVTMAEFADKWTQYETAEFARYDINGDGVITPDECAVAHKRRVAEELAAQQAAEAQLPAGTVRSTADGRVGP